MALDGLGSAGREDGGHVVRVDVLVPAVWCKNAYVYCTTTLSVITEFVIGGERYEDRIAEVNQKPVSQGPSVSVHTIIVMARKDRVIGAHGSAIQLNLSALSVQGV